MPLNTPVTIRGSSESKEQKKNLNMNRYLNRHLVYPSEMGVGDYYRVDDKAKNKEYRGIWVELIGSKWIAHSGKIAWYCHCAATGSPIFTLYLDGTTRKNANASSTKKWLNKRSKLNELILTKPNREHLIEKLRHILLELEKHN
jgi:hypothetical protein